MAIRHTEGVGQISVDMVLEIASIQALSFGGANRWLRPQPEPTRIEQNTWRIHGGPWSWLKGSFLPGRER